MNDTPGPKPVKKTWLERLSQILSTEPKDQQELIELLHAYQQRDLFDSDALAMLEGVLEVDDMQVREAMIPRGQIVMLDHEESLEDMLRSITQSGHSRFPVYGDNRDEIQGILLAKDLLHHFSAQNKDDFDIKDFIRPAIFIPESKRLNILLKDFRASRNHMAIVADEYGGVAGLITIEDVLEQIVGDIDDEHDDDESIDIQQHGVNRYSVRALTDLDDFNEYFDGSYAEDDVETIGGLVLQAFGHLPKRGEVIEIENFGFKVLSADSRRIYELQVRRLTQQIDIPDEL